MDSHQVGSVSKKSKKRKKKPLEREESKLTEAPPPRVSSFEAPSCSVSVEENLLTSVEVKPLLARDTFDPSVCSDSVRGADAVLAKPKCHKQKKVKSKAKESDSPPSESAVVSISASFIPVVEEALRLLEASGNQTNCPKANPKRSSDKNQLFTDCGEIGSIVSQGAQKLSSNFTSGSFPATTLEHFAGSTNPYVRKSALNPLELEFLKSASSVGPIYSRSSLSSSVTSTSSSLSSQLSVERTQSSHLYSGNLEALPCEVSITNKMSAPSASQKSREDVEAERKARKASKAATKGKATVKDQDLTLTHAQPDKMASKGGVSAKKKDNTTKTTNSESSLQKAAVETLTEGLKKISISENVKQESKVSCKDVDTPDFARTHVAPHAVVIPSELLQMMDKKQESNVKSKAELKAERRAKQEAQRAAKAQQLVEKQQAQKSQENQGQLKPSKPSAKVLVKDLKVAEEGKQLPTSKLVKNVKTANSERRVKLFSHLYQNSFKNVSETIGVSHPQYHSSIVRLGVQYASRVVLGSNARCLALLYSLKDLIADYETPPQKEFSRGLEAYLQPNMDFLQQCRPHSVSMVNALRYIKWQLTQIRVNDSEHKAKQHILEAIDQYVSDQIGKAAEAIGKVVKDKIDDNDVILVYACSSLVLSALKVALDEKRKFHVIVVDSLPWLEGREMLRRLVSMGVQCSYVHISAASFVMRQASKVLLGAHALLANGYVMSRAGSSQVALLAHAYNVPVLVCCETHKFSERVQTDSFVYNELANPDELIGAKRAGERETERERPLANWRDIPSLSLLNLVYDVTPPDLVTAVVTERAILPCTSVPVILRIKPTEC